MRIPYVIDNQNHRLADVLNALLDVHKGRSLDVATAYFTVGGFRLIKEGLLNLGSFRLLLGAEPTSGEQATNIDAEAVIVGGLARDDLRLICFDLISGG